MTTDNLIRLLRLTADNKSPIVQDLRNEIVKYVNEQEYYISQLETDNFQMFKILWGEIEMRKREIAIVRELFLNECKKQQNAN